MRKWIKYVRLCLSLSPFMPRLSLSPYLRHALPLAAAVLLLSLPSIAAQIVEAQQGQPGNKGGWYVRGWVANGTPIAAADPPILVAGQDGTNLRTILTDAAGRVVTTGGALGQVYSPGIPTPCALAAATSCPLTAFAAAGSCLRISCSVDASYRAGAGAQVALTSDNPLSAKTVERFCFTAAQDSLAFISASAGTCYAAVVAVVP